MNNYSSKEQLPRNLAGNIVYFFVNFIIGLLLVPYFISTLGVAAYGIIPLATSLSGYVGILTDSLNSAVSRFLTVDLQKEDYTKANKTFNTAFFTISGLILIMVPLVLTLSFFAPTIFNVPLGQETETILLFLGVSSAFLIRSWSANFTVSLFAYNRLDLLNLVSSTNIIVQVLMIVLFFSLIGPSLALVGLAFLIGSVSASVLAIIFSRRHNPHLTINIQFFERSRLHELSGMGWWVIVNQIGSLLFLSSSLIVVNLFFGATLTGEYAIASQWVALLYAIAGTLSGVLTPTVLTYYAKEKTESLLKVSKSAVKMMGLSMALPIGLICGFAPELLTVWVGKEYSFLAPLMIILTGNLAINLAVLPLFSINIAYNRVKIPGILTLFMGIGNLVLAIILSVYTGWGYYGVAIAVAIVLTLKNTFFIPWYATRVLGIPTNTFTRAMFPGIVATIIIAICAAFISQIFYIASLFSLIIAGGLIVIVYLIAIWPLGLDVFERDIFSSYLPLNVRRFFK
ncbi:MAG: polysaccharide biosynthesis protein [Methanomicrobiales archaeon HGW-Methanomicrobiales-1]|jgi:membrane protein EpsK|nr:MAG: polysaccharide biosynthesis protein [Methanomicrobiales archaeon HGW-Methanomicrobiales-1]